MTAELKEAILCMAAKLRAGWITEKEDKPIQLWQQRE